MGRYLGRHTSSIDNVSQSDTALDEAIELQGFAQVDYPPNTGSNVASIGNVSEDIMQRYLGEHTGSIDNASQSNTAPKEAMVLQGFAQVHRTPNADNDVASIGNISEEALGRYLGRHTSSIDNASQSDTATGLQGFAQAHQPPNTDSDVASSGNVSEEAMQRYLGEHSGSQHSTCQSDTASHEGVWNVHNDQINNTGYEATGSVSHEDIEMQVLPQMHQLPNTDNDDSDVL